MDEQIHGQRAAEELAGFSSELKAYVNGFEGQEKFSHQIAMLEPLLSDAEKAELNSLYLDPITYEVMDIPVLLNEVYYDLDTLLNLPSQETPIAREPFEYHQIELANIHKADLLKEFIARVKQRIDEGEE